MSAMLITVSLIVLLMMYAFMFGQIEFIASARRFGFTTANQSKTVVDRRRGGRLYE